MRGIDPDEFVLAVTPSLQKRDWPGLTLLLQQQWSSDDLKSLLACRCRDARKVAALCVGLVGKQCALPQLAKLLRDEDPMVNQMAEHAMWSIWFRSSSKAATCALHHGAKALDSGDFDAALDHFARALEHDPEFSEAYNQRGLAYYLIEDFEASARNCEEVIHRMPFHFGAWTGLGHCHAHQHDFKEAARCYEKSLSINPHQEQIQQVVRELKRKLRDT